MNTVCSKCNTVITLRTDPRKVRVLPSGAVVCDRCYWESKGKKKRFRSRGRGRGFHDSPETRGRIMYN